MAGRNLYLTNISVEEAFERFQEALRSCTKPESELIRVVDSLDRVTYDAVYARNNSPLYDSAAMDGVAVISSCTHGASEASPRTLKHDDYLPIDTGDPIKPPYNAVIMAEDIQETDSGEIIIRASAAPWQHVRPVGEDIVQGEMILPARHKVRPMDVGVLLSGGITQVVVYKSPKVAIIPTGTELVESGAPVGEGDIIESNSRMLEAFVRQGGGTPYRFDPIPDEYELIKETVQNAADEFDFILICAGTSAGREDHTVHVLRQLGEVIVHGVSMKPGKPVILATVNGKPVVGLPGYPVSTYLAYETFAAHILASFSGHSIRVAPTVQATLTRRLVSSLKHREYVRVKLGKVGERLIASPLARGAGAAMSLVRADGFCVIAQDSEGVEAGAEVSVMLCRELQDLERTVVSIGSHDLTLDVIADMMPNIFPGTFISGTHVGSMGGLIALRSGEAHIAPIHLLDEKTGIYNIPAVKKLFVERKMALIKGVGRVQGIMVSKGNPMGITGLNDLPRCRYVNRQRGAGTRVLLDFKLKQLGIDPTDIEGYEREAATHMAVAAAIKGDAADAGVGILSAANAMELDFIPIGNEEYDFAIPTEHLELEHIRCFIEMLKNHDFHRKLEQLGGYTTERCGEVVIIEA